MGREIKSNALATQTQKIYSSAFLNMQTKDKKGINNPMFGKIKSAETINKLQKIISVYDYKTKNFIAAYSTVECSKFFKMGKDTLTKYLNNGGCAVL